MFYGLSLECFFETAISQLHYFTSALTVCHRNRPMRFIFKWNHFSIPSPTDMSVIVMVECVCVRVCFVRNQGQCYEQIGDMAAN